MESAPTELPPADGVSASRGADRIRSALSLPIA